MISRAAQHPDRELDAPFDRRARAADDVARHAYDEQIADSLVKDQLGCHPRVGTANDDGHGRLPFGQRGEIFRPPPGMDQLPGNEPLVTLEQPGQHLIGSGRRGPLARGQPRPRQR